jgi:hypothetical protein
MLEADLELGILTITLLSVTDTDTIHGTNLISVLHIISGIVLSDSITGTLPLLFSDRDTPGITVITAGGAAAVITDTIIIIHIILITYIIIILLQDTLLIIPRPEGQITARDQQEKLLLPEDHKPLIQRELVTHQEL